MDVQILEYFLTASECETLRSLVDCTKRPHFISLEKSPYAIGLIQQKLNDHNLPHRVVGDRVTMGRYDPGQYLGKHADQSYQGGNACLLIYLNDVYNGGHTVFYSADSQVTCAVAPREGVAVIFGTDHVHEATAVDQGFKYVLGCELLVPTTRG